MQAGLDDGLEDEFDEAPEVEGRIIERVPAPPLIWERACREMLHITGIML